MSKYLVALVACATAACSPDNSLISIDAPAVVTTGLDAQATLGNTFRFAIVGDTRPPNPDDVAGYPTAIITTIWDDVEQVSPKPDFAIATGDYQFSSIGSSSTVNQQLDLYLGARAHYSNPVLAVMGNHECTGFTSSNCGGGNRDGLTPLYTAFMNRMVMPLGFTRPYYEVKLTAQDATWTAKIVMVAANAWDATQERWLEQVLAEPTTYTFVVRHESINANTAPGVLPSEVIIRKP